MAKMTLIPLEDALDERFGKTGTPARDLFENEVEHAVSEYRMGETIRAARIRQNLTQEQLGERIGVQKAQISKIEKGRNITLRTIARVAQALGIPTSIEFEGIGKIALW